MFQVRMLGRFEVISDELVIASFRSRKVGSLLAFLALNLGKPISNATLQELLWPDSDGDRQSQSFRKAISDLRDALEGQGVRGALVRTDQGSTSLAEDQFETDACRFEELLSDSFESPGFESKAIEAIALYGGPLLAPFEDDWVFAYRRKYEELYCSGVLGVCRMLNAKGMGREASRIANTAIVLAPLREEPYIASIQAYASMNNKAMAIRQFEALEKMLDDHFGQTPSEAAQQAMEIDVTNLYGGPIEPVLPSGGAIDADSRYYVERDADKLVDEALARQEAVVLVFGPRQTGKTSLLARSGGKLRRRGAQVAISDFQTLGKSEMERPATLYRALIHSFATQLGLTYEPSWNEWVGPNSNLDSHIDTLLHQTTGPVCWAMDEVDRLFGTDYADDFFGLVRSWHNRRALDPEGPWKRLSLLISYATEAHLFIKDLNQSPFNVGVRVNLRDFSEREVQELGGRFTELVGRSAKEVFEVTRGHPFLTRRAFAFLEGGRTIEELRKLAAHEDGPFGEHLRLLGDRLAQQVETTEEVLRLLKGKPFASASTRLRLCSAGVISDDPVKPEFRVPAYGQYLRHRFDQSGPPSGD